MNWEDVVPHPVAVQQHAWERRRAIFRARESGAQLKAIALKMGVSPPRVRQMYCRAVEQEDMVSPVERWLSDNPELTEMARASKFSGKWRWGKWLS